MRKKAKLRKRGGVKSVNKINMIALEILISRNEERLANEKYAIRKIKSD